jgi:hypothetical protein
VKGRRPFSVPSPGSPLSAPQTRPLPVTQLEKQILAALAVLIVLGLIGHYVRSKPDAPLGFFFTRTAPLTPKNPRQAIRPCIFSPAPRV